MSVSILPTFQDPFYTEIVDLDGTDFLFTVRFNQREGCWYFSLSTPEGEELVKGVKVTCLLPLLVRFADPRLPDGEIIAYSNSADDSPPGLDELGEGRRVELLYFSREEFENL